MTSMHVGFAEKMCWREVEAAVMRCADKMQRWRKLWPAERSVLLMRYFVKLVFCVLLIGREVAYLLNTFAHPVVTWIGD